MAYAYQHQPIAHGRIPALATYLSDGDTKIYIELGKLQKFLDVRGNLYRRTPCFLSMNWLKVPQQLN